MTRGKMLAPPLSSPPLLPHTTVNGRTPQMLSLISNSLSHNLQRKALKFSNSINMSSSSVTMKVHAFAGNPIKSKSPKPDSALETLKTLLFNTHNTNNDSLKNPSSLTDFKVLPFKKGRPLAYSSDNEESVPSWRLGWVDLDRCRGLLAGSGDGLSEDLFVYLGSEEADGGGNVVYWAIDVLGDGGSVAELGEERRLCFVELRTLMVATDWANARAMGELAIAGHARALLEWHGTSKFCSHCGARTVTKDAGRRKQCSNELCKKRVYPRVDPPGESLEEAVRRETWEETGVEVEEVIYHSSQPWPDAQWHSREDVKKSLTFAEYEKAQRTAATKIDQICKGVEQGQSLSLDFNVESGELAPMFIPGPFAIAHHLISSWVNQGELSNIVLTSICPAATPTHSGVYVQFAGGGGSRCATTPGAARAIATQTMSTPNMTASLTELAIGSLICK
ncbi:hypothetical protein Sjap_019203 [Stephania japonica]|uniref:Nudix hydrolase domain-containing protein n=1 Tax=Stephania japonica TaxID=461633 RepID=A0AAP0F784_9MAGN